MQNKLDFVPVKAFKKGCTPWNKGLTKDTDERIKKSGEKISKSLKGHRNFSKEHHSEETKRKMSLASIGKKKSKEHRVNISKGLMGRKLSKEHREKNRRNLINFVKSVEGRKKMSEAQKKAWKEGKYTEERNRKISESETGEKHYNWQGGKSFEAYGIEFNNKFKQAIRKRDNQICMLCQIHREKLNRALDVHHIDYNKLLSVPQNCISLCNSCHMKTNFNRKHWIKFLQDLLSEKYNYQYSESKEIIFKLNQNGGKT